MRKFTIKSTKLAGFAAESTKPGVNKIKVLVSTSLTSDDPAFYVFVRQITNLFLAKVGPPPLAVDSISKFLIILHDNDVVDIHVDDFEEIALAKLNKGVRKGELIYSNCNSER